MQCPNLGMTFTRLFPLATASSILLAPAPGTAQTAKTQEKMAATSDPTAAPARPEQTAPTAQNIQGASRVQLGGNTHPGPTAPVVVDPLLLTDDPVAISLEALITTSVNEKNIKVTVRRVGTKSKIYVAVLAGVIPSAALLARAMAKAQVRMQPR